MHVLIYAVARPVDIESIPHSYAGQGSTTIALLCGEGSRKVFASGFLYDLRDLNAG